LSPEKSPSVVEKPFDIIAMDALGLRRSTAEYRAVAGELAAELAGKFWVA
jgi:hypothetical protein